ncbi:MAG: hypothetical protein LBI05_11360 [Planctomycetaceae bacterium]|jgi:hypothetical protein|nr:hypothetical protein [Planctomycetaceae bacterium]
MNLNALTLPELEAQQEQLLNRLFRVRTAIQRQKGTESIPQQIARLPKRQRAFVAALWEAPNKKLELMELEAKVWGGKEKSPDYFRAFVGRIEKTFEKERLPLFIDTFQRGNGDIVGYKLKKIQKTF